jgi:hypothetical protein
MSKQFKSAALEKLKTLILQREEKVKTSDLWNQINLQTLLEPDSNGRNFFHFVSLNGSIKNLPEQYLTKENLLSDDNNGHNCYHMLISKGKLRDIPLKLLSKDVLKVCGKDGMTSYHASTLWNQGIGGIPDDLWDKEAITAGEHTKGATALHLAAKNKFRGIPETLITAETLKIKDKEGTSVLHEAIRNGGVSKIPRELLTPNALTEKNKLGVSPIEEDWLTYVPFEGQEIENPKIFKKMDVRQLMCAAEKTRGSEIKKLYEKEIMKRKLTEKIQKKGDVKTLEI